jgi:hypothetical protein
MVSRIVGIVMLVLLLGGCFAWGFREHGVLSILKNLGWALGLVAWVLIAWVLMFRQRKNKSPE